MKNERKILVRSSMRVKLRKTYKKFDLLLDNNEFDECRDLLNSFYLNTPAKRRKGVWEDNSIIGKYKRISFMMLRRVETLRTMSCARSY